jgi:hypothetical protein
LKATLDSDSGDSIATTELIDTAERRLVASVGQVRVLNWTGTIDRITPRLHFAADLAVRLSCRNAAFIVGSVKLTDSGSTGPFVTASDNPSVYVTLKDLKTGDNVYFNGRFEHLSAEHISVFGEVFLTVRQLVEEGGLPLTFSDISLSLIPAKRLKVRRTHPTEEPE